MRIAVLVVLFSMWNVAAQAASGAIVAAMSQKVNLHEPPSNVPQLFPNPAMDFIQLADEKQRVNLVCIYNLLGRKVLQFEITEGSKYNISALSSGIYLAQMLDKRGDIVATQRLHKR